MAMASIAFHIPEDIHLPTISPSVPHFLPSDGHQAIVQGSGTGAQLALSQVEEVLESSLGIAERSGQVHIGCAANDHDMYNVDNIIYVPIHIHVYICIYI